MGMKPRQSKYIEDVLHIQCSNCKEFKELDEYYKNKTAAFERTYSCKVCYTTKIKEDEIKEKEFGALSTVVDKGRLDSTIGILTSMGFDVNQNVSNQFYERIKNKYGIDLS